MNNTYNISISLDKDIDKQKLVFAISQVLKIKVDDVFFLNADEKDVSNTKVFIDFTSLTDSELFSNINISIVELQNYNSQTFEIEFATSLSKQLNMNVNLSAPGLFDYSIIKIEPNGEFYGANEDETEDEFEYLEDITLLNKQDIENLKRAIVKEIIEEQKISEQTLLVDNYTEPV